MEINLYLLLALLIALLVIGYLLAKLHRVRGQLSLIKDALTDIKNGNLNRRVLARESDLTKQICYDINEIAMSSQSRLIQQKQSEQAYKRLMTSLSHDVKTPLASLVGYLEAVESKMVTGAEQEEYIRVATEKAYHLKDFVTALFEWVKLDAGEQIFHFEVCDLNELSRDIMADWVPLLGGKHFGVSLSRVSAPQIPLLASGGVIRQPTLAMMGEYAGAGSDPEIAAPQSAIGEAVAAANGDVVDAVLTAAQQIIDAIRENGGGVVLSDAVIGRAVRRYNSRQAVITGGAGY